MRTLLTNESVETNSMGVHRPPDKSAYWKSIFFIFHPKICYWYSKESSQIDGSFEHPKHMFKLMGKKIITILRS